MNKFLSNIYDKAERFFLQNAPHDKVLVEAFMRRGEPKERLSNALDYQAASLKAENMQRLKMAVATATDPDTPDRTIQGELIENLLLDNHLRSLIDSRILFSQRSPIKMVNEAGDENKDLTWLLERPWFYDLIYKVIFKEFGGTRLLELYALTPDGELAEVGEIPISHFNARKGIIMKRPGDLTGWNYKEGVYANYYVQIGKDDELGMLMQLAPIVLAKKLALGSWQDYVEKYGVPPLFITTDREDDGRLNELYQAALRFKSNGFMVGRGQEKFEIGNIGGAGIAPFESLAKYANDELGKGVLGGSGITDEKSFVGSAEIQFKLAKDRFEKDKGLFKYVFNTLIKPKLVNLSPVYAGFANHYLEWDDTENMSKAELIDNLVKLGAIFEIDPEYIYEQTGIPVIGYKNAGGTGGTPEKK